MEITITIQINSNNETQKSFMETLTEKFNNWIKTDVQ